MTSAQPIVVRDRSSVGEARRRATAIAETAGLPAERIAVVSVIATELAVNLHLHGGGGEFLVHALADEPGIQILTIDRGRGMANVERCLQDGYSTSGTAGQGLGAVRRMASSFDIHSQIGTGPTGGQSGTVVLARVAAGAESHARRAYQCGGVSVAVEGESICGDGWGFRQGMEATALLVADGLGHGPLAAEASAVALHAFSKLPVTDPAAFLTQAHALLRPTRGAAAAMASFHGDQVRFAGVGNVAGRIVSETASRSMISHNGTLGLQATRFADNRYPWPANAIVVLASDGILTNWTLQSYPGLLRRQPAVIAAILYRDWRRGRDDSTVAVVRRTPEALAS